MCISLLFNWATGWPGSYVAAAGLGFSVFLASIFGDLVESSMKREANMKVNPTNEPRSRSSRLWRRELSFRVRQSRRTRAH
jgi:hypothetical protein